MKLPYWILLIAGLLMGKPGFGQAYSHCDTLELTTQTQGLLRSKFLPKLINILKGGSEVPPQGIVNSIKGLITSCFNNDKVMVYNDFNPELPAELPIENYLTLNNTEVVGSSIDWGKMRYELIRTEVGPVVNLYGQKTIQLANGKGVSNLLEFRLRYTELGSGFTDYKIVGIRKINALPARARLLPAEATSLTSCRQQELSLGFVLKKLAADIRRNLPSPVQKIVLEKFTYNNAGIPNAFSDEVYSVLKTELLSQGIEATLPVRSLASTPVRVKGSYTRDINELKIKAEVVDNQSGKTLATTENSDLPIRWLSENKLVLEPDNLLPALAVQDTIKNGALPANSGNGLTIQVKTNKGRDGVEFYEGQKMTLSVRATKPCFVRMLYLFQDGTKTLLIDNYPIKPGQENQDVSIQTKFDLVCSAPFGQEYLLTFAAPDPFKTLPTQKHDGYDIVTAPLSEILATIRKRGFKKTDRTTNAKAEASEPAPAEDRIKIISRAL